MDYPDSNDDEGILSGYPPTPSGSVVSGSHEDLYAKYSKILGEDNPALPMINDYLSRRPDREALMPKGASKWQNITMGFAQGLGSYDVHSGNSDPLAGYKTTKSLTDQPFIDARSDWADEAKQVDLMASLSERQHENKLRSAQWDITSELNRQRQDSLERARLARIEETKRAHEAAEKSRPGGGRQAAHRYRPAPVRRGRSA